MRSPDFVKKYYFLAELLIVEYQYYKQNISVTNNALHK